MSGVSPSSVLFSSDGYELAVVANAAFIAGTRSLLVAGNDGTNTRTILIDSSGRQVVVGAGVAGTPTGGVLTIQGDPSGTPVPISGTVTATNPSVGTNNAAALGFDTQVGGIVATAAPTLTNGNLSALSLTTLGGLRIDGIYATGTATGTAADAIVSGGYVTTAAPTYTTGQLNALSLDTNGSLRVVQKRATSSTVTAVAAVANSSYTALASNANRIATTIFNNTNKTLHIKLGTTASTSSFTTVLFAQAYWEVPVEYTGIIDVFSPSGASGTVLVTELVP